MNKNLTEMIFILDRSGSMAGLESDTIGGFNSLITKQKQHPGDALVTTVLFDNVCERLHDRAKLHSVPPMDGAQYFVRGSTALLDAIGATIRNTVAAQGRAKEEDRPGQTIVVIITDGMENASREYNRSGVRAMIELQKANGWEFIFLGANIDAISTARSFGIAADRAADYLADKEGTALSYESISETVSCMRAARPVGADWKQRIDEDFRRRSNR